MKNYLNIIFFLLFPICLNAQSPLGINYQAVASNELGAELVNQNINVKFTILSGSPVGQSEYVELHPTTTDSYGLFNLVLGQGYYQSGNASTLAEINWGDNTHYLKVELDPSGNNSFIHMGTQQMMSVPYALYAESSGDGGDSDSQNEIQSLSFDGDTLSLSNGGGEVVFEQIVGTDSTMVADMISTAQSNSEIWIECVDMGIAQLCATLGLDSDATLGPDDNGYRYKLGCSNASSDNYISDPHWRKFKIHGLNIDDVEELYIRYRYSNTSFNLNEMTPEVDENGNVYFYVYKAVCGNTCATTANIGAVIPLSSAVSVGNNWNDLQLFYTNGTSLVDTKLMFTFN